MISEENILTLLDTNLFIASFEITNEENEMKFRLYLNFYTPEKIIHGTGRITEPTDPPLDVATRLQGSYSYIEMPDANFVDIKATGYDITKLPEGDEYIESNITLRLVLNGDWQTGKAMYSYMNEYGNFIENDDCTVNLLQFINY